jgi:L-ascorbate metabolism protein UlaG (beta-lactamase superfamily)
MISSERAVRRVTFTWYGQAGFRLEGGDSRVLIDPFMSDRGNRRYQPVAGPEDPSSHG